MEARKRVSGAGVRLVSHLAAKLLDRGRPRRAAMITDVAARLIISPRLRAALYGNLTAAEIERGRQPSRLAETVRTELAIADQELARGAFDRSAASFARAMSEAFHRAVHFDRLDSPLPADPARFTEPLRASTTARAIRQPRGRAAVPTAFTAARPRRVLLATMGNTNFIGPIRDYLEREPRAELQTTSFSSAKELKRWVAGPAALAQPILSGNPELTAMVEKVIRPQLDWADTILVDWCTSLAALITVIDPRDTRVIVRLHSFEAFSWWPHVVDFTRVDDVVFVSEHLRDLALAAVPGLLESGVRTTVVPLGIDTSAFVRPKLPDARFTLGLVGYSQIAKDPCWAFAVLRLLRAHDERYRLLLIGSELQLQGTAAARAYLDRFRKELRALERAGAVERLGQTGDVAGVLTRVGIILSTSVRESFHLGLVEGAASAAVPVVRNWPLFAGRERGAATLFPPDWVVDTPAAAAARILEMTTDPTRWERTGEEAAVHARARWDTNAVEPYLDQLFFGR